MKRVLNKLLYLLLAIFVLLVGILTFLLTTTPGLYVLIRIGAIYVPGHISIHQLSGRFLDKFSIADLEYSNDTINVKAHQVTMDWQLRPWVRQVRINSVHADFIEIRKNIPTYTLYDVKLNGLLNQKLLQIDNLSFDFFSQSVASQLRMDLISPKALLGAIKINPGSINPLKPKGTIDITGFVDDINWAGEVKGPLGFTIKGSLKNKKELQQVIKWRDHEWRIDPKQSLYSPKGQLTVAGTLPALSLELATQLNNSPKEYWQLMLKLKGELPLQWTIDAQLNRAVNASSVSGLYTTLGLKGHLKGMDQAQLNLTVAPGRYLLAKDSLIPVLEFTGGTIKSQLSAIKLQVNGGLSIDENKQIKLNLSLPDFTLQQGLSREQKIKGQVTLAVNSLAFIQAMTPEIDQLKGQMEATIEADGTIGKANIKSNLTLQHLSFTLPKLGTSIDALDLVLTGVNNRWQTKGSISSAGKKLLLTGQLSSIYKGELQLNGNDFTLMNTNEYQIHISPQLKLILSPTTTQISGSILVPYAQIKPQSFNNSVGLSSDVVFKSKEKESTTSPLNTTMDIKVQLGEAVELNAKGLHGLLNGAVLLKQEAHGPITATGELTVSKGQYKAYGQDLNIEQGQLIYSGGQLDNPEINLKAAKTIERKATTGFGSNELFDFNKSNQAMNLGGKIKVGVEVSGRLTDPKILLFSNPSLLSQADILSMLVLGRPASDANKAGAQLLLTALTSMDLGGGTSNTAQLIEQFKQNYGVDFNVQTNSNYNAQTKQMTDSTSVVVTKTLSKRLNLSYNVGLSQADPNVLTLKYLLNQFFSLQVSSSDNGNGIDLMYSRSKDKL